MSQNTKNLPECGPDYTSDLELIIEDIEESAKLSSAFQASVPY